MQLLKCFSLCYAENGLNLVVGCETRRFAPVGEIDFVILHPEFGILVLEVKGGTWRYNGKRKHFELLRRDRGGDWSAVAHRDILVQAQANVRAMQKTIRSIDAFSHQRIGCALVFPECDIQGRPFPPGLRDPSTGDTLVLDVHSLPQLATEVVRIMQYWRKAFRYPDRRDYQDAEIGQARIDKMLAALVPVQGYEIRLVTQVAIDQEKWLVLRPEQAKCLDAILGRQRSILHGGSGTGKTLIAAEYARRKAKENKRVLVLTFNRLLCDRLAKALPNPRIQVDTIDHLRWQAIKLLGQAMPDKITKAEREAILDAALREAFQRSKYGFDVVVIDEAQSFRPTWLEIVVGNCRGAQILACCDETQIFDHERESGQFCELQRILDVLEVPTPFPLLLNLRSPQAVFDRLCQLGPPSGQRYSLRDPDPMGLQEIVAQSVERFAPIERVLAKLHNEGVPASDIIVLGPPRLETYLSESNLRDWVGQVSTVYRFRGCEAPVVVVWWDGTLDSPALLCAYARATTRCIVIYRESVLHGQASTPMGKALLDAPVSQDLKKILNRPTILEARPGEDKFIQSLRYDDNCLVARHTAKVSWSTRLGGWLVEENECSDQVAVTMWRDALISSLRFDVYCIGEGHDLLGWGRGFILRFSPVENSNKVIKAQYMCDGQCHDCGKRGIGFLRVGQDSGSIECLDCIQAASVGQPIPEKEIGQFGEYDEILVNWADVTNVRKRALPLSLFALARWRRCNYSPGKGYLKRDLSMMQDACRTLLFADICDMEPGDSIDLAEMRDRYVEWYPTLDRQVDEKSWQGYIATLLNGLSGRKRTEDCWLKRIESKELKEFARLPDPSAPLDPLASSITQYTDVGFASATDMLWALFFRDLCESYYYYPDGYRLTDDQRCEPGFWLPRLDLWFSACKVSFNDDAVSNATLLGSKTGLGVVLFRGLPGEGIPLLYVSDGWEYEQEYAKQFGWQIVDGSLEFNQCSRTSSPRLMRAYKAVQRANQNKRQAQNGG